MILQVTATSSRILKPEEKITLDTLEKGIEVRPKTRPAFLIQNPQITFRTRDKKTEITITGTLENCQESGKGITLDLE